MHVLSRLAGPMAALLAITTALDPTRLVYEFPNGTWAENLAVRRCGSVLITTLTGPNLYMVDPLAHEPKATLVNSFPSATWLAGITETVSDTFYVVAANGSFSTFSTLPGTNRLFRVSFPRIGEPNITLAATLADAGLLNGLATFNPTTVLSADSRLGVVWATDVTTGKSFIAVDDPLMKPNSNFMLGINGIKILHGRVLYFTCSAQMLLGRVELRANGSAAGDATRIFTSTTRFDDFAIDEVTGNAFIATQGGNSIAEVDLKTGAERIVAGMVNSTEIAEPTSAQFGRTRLDAEILYVTTAGGIVIPVNGDEVVGGQLVAVETRCLGRRGGKCK